MKLRLAHKVIITIAIPVIFQACFFGFLLKSVSELDQLEKTVRATANVLVYRNQISVCRALMYLYCGLSRVSQKPEHRAKFAEYASVQVNAFHKLDEQFKDVPVKRSILREGWNIGILTIQGLSSLMRAAPPKNMTQVLGSPAPILGINMIQSRRLNMEKMFDSIEKSQEKLMQESEEKEDAIKKSILIYTFASLLISLCAGLIFSQSITSRLKKVVDNIKMMGGKDEQLLPVGGNDEIAALNLAIVNTDRQIKEAEQFQAQTAHIVAQELEEPLRQIRDSFIEMKKSGFERLDANGEERVERSLFEVGRLRALVTDLISLDKISKIGWQLQSKTLDLSVIAANAVDTVNDYAKQAQVEIVLKTQPTLVTGDPARVQQIALNLLTNAIKFSPANSTIEITTAADGNFGKLSIADRGTGIPDEFQQSIFGHFEQATRTDATEKGGSGLGLAISKRLVESQQGRMGFQSKLGQGSTFWFSLPTVNSNSEVNSESVASVPVFEPATDAPSSFHPTLWRKLLLMVLLPLAVQLLTSVTLWNVIGSIRENVNEFNRVSQMTSYHAKLVDALARATFFATLYNVEPTESFVQQLRYERRSAFAYLSKIQNEARSNSSVAKIVQPLEAIVNNQIAVQDQFMLASEDANPDQFFGPKNRDAFERSVTQLVDPLDEAISREKTLVEKNILGKAEMREVVEKIAILFIFSIFLVSVFLGIYIIRRFTARAGKIADNAKLFAAREPLPEPSTENDEIAFVEQSFYAAANKLLKLERFKQELIALTSHEFRTPLTSLLAKVDLMDAGVFGPINERGKAIVAATKQSIIDLISLLTNLLDVEKILSGKVLVQKSEVQIDDVLTKTERNLTHLLSSKNIQLKVAHPEISVRADAIRLVQSLTAVLNDIILNAPANSSISLNAIEVGREFRLTVLAPGGECAKNALNKESARGRLAADLLRLIVQQHGGSMNLESDDKQLLLRVTLDGSGQ
jgi:signal transduction histidine kinase